MYECVCVCGCGVVLLLLLLLCVVVVFCLHVLCVETKVHQCSLHNTLGYMHTGKKVDQHECIIQYHKYDELTVQLFVKSDLGRSSYCINHNDTVDKLRSMIEQKEGICPDDLNITFAGRHLESGRILHDYNVQNHSLLYVDVKLRGGAKKVCILASIRHSSMLCFRCVHVGVFVQYFFGVCRVIRKRGHIRGCVMCVYRVSICCVLLLLKSFYGLHSLCTGKK